MLAKCSISGPFGSLGIVGYQCIEVQQLGAAGDSRGGHGGTRSGYAQGGEPRAEVTRMARGAHNRVVDLCM